MTDRSKTRIFKLIELDLIKDLKTGLTIKADRLIEKFIRSVAPEGQVIGTTATTVDLGSVLESKEISVLPDNSVQVDYTDFYDFSIVITAKSSAQNILRVWAEVYDADLDQWTVFPESGRLRNFSNNNSGVLEFSTKLTLTGGLRFRIRANTDSGSVTLGDSFNNGTEIIGVPAVVMSLARI